MKLLTKFFGYLLFGVVILGGCEDLPFEESEDEEENESTLNDDTSDSAGGGSSATTSGTSSDSAPGSMTMTGTLVLGITDFSLTSDVSEIISMDIICTTYGADSSSCSIPIAPDGSFNGECPNLVGTTFSCVLREDGKVVGDFEFADQHNMFVGNGIVSVEVSVDPKTGNLDSAINESESTALNSEKVASSLLESAAVSTDVQSILPGAWALSCDLEDESLVDSHLCPEGSSIYISSYEPSLLSGLEDSGDGSSSNVQKLFSVWRNQETFNECVSSTENGVFTEKSPNWHVNVNLDTPLNFLFGNPTEIGVSLDNIFSDLSDTIKLSINETVDSIYIRALTFKSTIDSIRSATSEEFQGILEYRIPSQNELRRRLLLRLIYSDPEEHSNLDYCQSLTADDSLSSAYRRIHSLLPELLCQFKQDGVIEESKTLVATIAKNSCMPKIFFDFAFNPLSRREEAKLLCLGSSNEDGLCFNDDDEFVGQILGRYSIMRLEEYYDGVFDLSFKNISEQLVVHPKEGVISCKIQTRKSIRGELVNTGEISMTFSDHDVDRCSDSGASDDVHEIIGNRSNAQIGRYAKSWKSQLMKVD